LLKPSSGLQRFSSAQNLLRSASLFTSVAMAMMAQPAPRSERRLHPRKALRALACVAAVAAAAAVLLHASAPEPSEAFLSATGRRAAIVPLLLAAPIAGMAGAVSAHPLEWMSPQKAMTDAEAKAFVWPTDCHAQCQNLCTEVLGQEPGYCDILCLSCTFEKVITFKDVDPRSEFYAGALILSKNIKLENGKKLSAILFQ